MSISKREYIRVGKGATHLSRLDNDVVSLTRVNLQGVGSVWCDWIIISADDSHVVVVEVNGIRA